MTGSSPPAPDVTVPVIVVADPGYVGQEAVAEELGPGFTVAVACGFEEALAAIAERTAPIVLVPDNLEPLRGAELLGRLSAQGLDLVGLLLVDEPDLRRLVAPPLPGVHALIVRPLREGALRLHVRAAVNERERLVALRTRAARGDADLDELLTALRHELRGQLQGMVGLATLLGELSGERLEPEGREWLARIVHSGERVTRLTDDLVVHLRLGRRPLEPSRVDVAALTEELVDDLLAADPELALDVAYEGPRLRVGADRRALAHALRHLLGNAVRYAARRVRVSVAPTAAGGFVVTVADDGPGLPPDARERVFGLFERHHADAADRRAGGGVGLATVARVAALHGGRAWMDAPEEGGAAFRLWLPDGG